MTNAARARLEALRLFIISAVSTGAVHTTADQFTAVSHLCTAALAGEEWAAERLTSALAQHGKRASKHWHEKVFAAIARTDATRPDGAVARGSIEV